MEGVGVTAGAPASQVSSPTGASTPPASALPWVEGGAESRVSDARSHACCMCGVTRVGCVCWPGSAGARLHVRTTQGGVRLKDKAGLFHLQDPNFGEGGSGGVGWPQGTPWVRGPDNTPPALHRGILTAFQDILPAPETLIIQGPG